MEPDLLQKLFEAPKKISGKPQWHQADSTWLRLTCSLEVGGGTVEGLELRGGAIQTLPDRAVRFHLQYYPAKGPCTGLARIEWRPEFGRMRAGNLVIARPLNPDPTSYEELLAIVENEFRISGLDRIDRPGWRLGDLFGA